MDLSEWTPRSARHPWEMARAHFFVSIVGHLIKGRSAVSILDVGAGDAYMSRQIASTFPNVRVVAWDRAYSDEEMRALRAERVELVRDRPAGPFDIALLLDVLEHVPDDAALLREVAPSLTPDADLVVSVPAWPRLTSMHDIKLRHLRRYTPRMCRDAIERAGFEVVRAGGLFHALLPLRAIATALSNRLLVPIVEGAGDWRAGPALTSVVMAVLRVDTALSRALSRLRFEVPGLSYFAVCRRAKQPPTSPAHDDAPTDENAGRTLHRGTHTGLTSGSRGGA